MFYLILHEVIGIAMFILIVLASAKFQARYTWYDNHADKRVPVDKDEHNLILWKRILYTIPVIAYWYMTFGFGALIGLIGLVAIHPFFHNGMLFVSYNKLKPNSYPLGWKDRSKKYTADGYKKMVFDWNVRMALLIASLLPFIMMIETIRITFIEAFS